MVNLSTKAKELFRDRMSRLSDADLQNHPKVVAFKDGIHNSSSRGNGRALKGRLTLGQENHNSFAFEHSPSDISEAHWSVLSGNQNAGENTDEMDDEITVTQTEVNLICPLTKVRLSTAHWITFNSLTDRTGKKEPWFDGSY